MNGKNENGSAHTAEHFEDKLNGGLSKDKAPVSLCEAVIEAPASKRAEALIALVSSMTDADELTIDDVADKLNPDSTPNKFCHHFHPGGVMVVVERT